MKGIVLTRIGLLVILLMGAFMSSVFAHEARLDLRFDEGSGDKAKDSSRFGNDGTLKGAQWTDGKRGKAVRMDGTTFVRVRHHESLNVAGPFTVEFWLSGSGGDVNIMAKVEDENVGGDWFTSNYGFAFGGEGQIRFVVAGGKDDVDANIVYSNTVVGDNKWHHIAGTFDGTTQTVYVDGKKLESEDKPQARGNAIKPKPNNGDLYIGKGAGWGKRGFPGILDEVKLWDGALSPDEVKSAMEGKLVSQAVTPLDKLSTTWGRVKSSY